MIKLFEKLKIKNVHFIGICGVSMSSLAKFISLLGYSVTGSDVNFNKQNFVGYEIKVFPMHDSKNLNGVDVVIYSSAISNDNPEYSYAIKNGMRILKRSELLRIIEEDFQTVIGIAGCHGKTTTACMLANIFRKSNKKFYAHIGGKDSVLGDFIYSGNECLISEVCEYKRNISYFICNKACVLNVAPDHMDCYKDMDDLVREYYSFLDRANIPIINNDDKILKRYKNSQKITFGIESDSNYKCVDLKENNGRFSFSVLKNGEFFISVDLKICGKHNVYNALASIAIADSYDISKEIIKNGLEDFYGAERRFETVYDDKVKFIADYAHHPEEISSTINTAKSLTKGKVKVVFQPHTYSRTKLLLDDFIDVLKDVKSLIIYKTYSARETPDCGYDARFLSQKLRNSLYADTDKDLINIINDQTEEGDLWLVLGAGDIYDKIKRFIKSGEILNNTKEN